MAGESILVVDDNLANSMLASTVLLAKGYDVRVAASGAELTRLLATCRPRLILMDIQLPDANGLELTRALKAAPETRGILIVALSAYAMKGDPEKARLAGCDGYITKPIDTRTLAATIATYLR